MNPGADPGIPLGGGANRRGGGGVPTYKIANFSEKLHEIEKIADCGVKRRTQRIMLLYMY